MQSFKQTKASDIKGNTAVLALLVIFVVLLLAILWEPINNAIRGVDDGSYTTGIKFDYTNEEQNTQTTPDTNVILGASLEEIGYTLPDTWEATLSEERLLLSPKNEGGFISVKVYDYNQQGRRALFCTITDYCIPEITEFTPTNIGNIQGYGASPVDNSGGGSEYFGAKGDKFYAISSFGPPEAGEFTKHNQNVMDSLVF